MKLFDFIKIVENEFPLDAAVAGDRIGLQVQSTNDEINRIHITYELNEAAIEEAIKNNAELIVSFHPLIYNPLQTIVSNDRVGKLVSKIIRSNMSLYVIHTVFDTYQHGTNMIYAKKLGLNFEEFLVPDLKYPHRGMGIIAGSNDILPAALLVQRIKQLSGQHIKTGKFDNSFVCKKIAIIGGSGSSYLSEALANKCDTIITADCTYHKFHEAEGKILIIDPGHYEMEKYVPDGIAESLKNIFDANLIFTISQVNTNPIMYF